MSRPAVLPQTDWLEHAIRKIVKIASRQSTVTSEDLRREFEAPENANQIGNAFKVAAHRKLITPIDFRPSRDKSRRGGSVRIWALHPSQQDPDV